MFGSTKKSPGRPAVSRGGGGLSFIGTDVTVSGDVASSGQIHVDGRVDGDVRCETLIQGEGGTIAGHIVCDTVHLAGLVDGTVQARLVTLEPSARVTGDVRYETLSIAAGATIDGRLTRKEGASLEAGPAPTAIVEPSAKATGKFAKAKKEEPGLLAMSGPAAAPSNA